LLHGRFTDARAEDRFDPTMFGNVDWRTLLVPSTSIVEIVLRGTVMYLALFSLLRVVLKREAGGLAMTDLLVVVLIADAAQNGLAGDYRSLPEGIVLVATIIFWSHALNWLGHRVPAIGRFVHPPPLPLIKNGVLMRRNMHHELITEEELMSQLRQHGIGEVAEVERACLEGDGRVSVIPKEKGGTTEPGPDHRIA